MSNNIPKGILRLYGAGGAGINVIGSWNSMDKASIDGTAECRVAYLDTSRSNLPVNVNEDNLFLIEDVDGSGKVRAENHQEISRSIKAMIQKHTPGDLNVVAFSASGGSGSVIGPLVMTALAEAGHPVVGLVIGSEESAITSKNTLNTLKSLDNMSRKKGLPLVISYAHNSADTPRSKVDNDCRFLLASLAVLASRQNRELDTKDLANWINFPKVTSVEPQLSLLHVYRKAEDVDAASSPISVASLLKTPDDPTFSIVPEYITVGFPLNPVKDFEQLHYVITVDGVQTISKLNHERVEAAGKIASARVKHDSIVSATDVAGDDGMIL
ncbi:hypothetical protein LUCX_44 [Xanthomonas phage vB_XciM_LucasX]|nr:hypothetical protein LUCX_44 [Xanthomonas phage vB_XciM_LucasX]